MTSLLFRSWKKLSVRLTKNNWGCRTKDSFNLGRVTPGREDELYGLTPLAIKMCRSTNCGQSQARRGVARFVANDVAEAGC